ncbi:hypothetical protein GE09DRAFT_630072 [Coniochaeta sp. 2T2.1]|nr:hypothetical protein GE09DRAFT_630072 [Coniochaeta sp. 2T2.1]
MVTPYNEMIIEADRISLRANIIAWLCSWWIMAGFLIVPNAFISLKKSSILQIEPGLARHLQVSLPIIAAVCFISGASGLSLLWRRYRHNYVWVSTRLLIPTFASASTCLFNILVSIYTAQDGYWSWPAYYAFASVVFTMVVTLLMLGIYQYRLGQLDHRYQG